jgi:hypothetical protein
MYTGRYIYIIVSGGWCRLVILLSTRIPILLVVRFEQKIIHTTTTTTTPIRRCCGRGRWLRPMTRDFFSGCEYLFTNHTTGPYRWRIVHRSGWRYIRTKVFTKIIDRQSHTTTIRTYRSTAMSTMGQCGVRRRDAIRRRCLFHQRAWQQCGNGCSTTGSIVIIDGHFTIHTVRTNRCNHLRRHGNGTNDTIQIGFLDNHIKG